MLSGLVCAVLFVAVAKRQKLSKNLSSMKRQTRMSDDDNGLSENQPEQLGLFCFELIKIILKNSKDHICYQYSSCSCCYCGSTSS